MKQGSAVTLMQITFIFLTVNK